MPIEIPKLRKLEGAQQTQGTRINQTVQGSPNIIGQRVSALADVGNTFLKAKKGYEDAEINTLGSAAEIEYNNWQFEKLEELKQIQDDPRKAYADYEVEENKKVDEILSKHPDLNERVKLGVMNKLEDARAARRDNVLRQRGKQVTTYKNNVYNTSMKQKQRNMPSFADHVDAKDPNSFKHYESGLDDIKTHFAKYALENGTAKVVEGKGSHSFVVPSEEPGGKPEIVNVVFTELGNNRLAKELSETITQSVEALIDLDRLEDAKALQEKFKDNIDGLNEAKINEQLKDGELKIETSGMANDISQLPIEQQRAAINKIQDPVVREEVDKKVDANMRRIDNANKRQNQKFYNTLSDYVTEKMNSSNPYMNVSDLENDPTYKKMIRHIDDPKLKDSLRESVIQPTETNPKSEQRIQTLIFGEDPNYDIDTISNAKFNEFLTGLNKKDRDYYKKKFINIRSKSNSEERSFFKSAKYQLETKMQGLELIEKNKKGFYEPEDILRLNEANSELMENLERMQGNMSAPALDRYINEYLAKVVEGVDTKNFKPSFGKLKKTRAEIVQEVNKVKAGKNSLKQSFSAAERRELKRKFKDERGYIPTSTDPVFLDFIKGN